jgi:predicted peptidase
MTGQILHKVFQPNDQTFCLTLPTGYNSNRLFPLVVGLHYGWPGRLPDPFFSQSYLEVLLAPAFKDLGVVIAAPDCLNEEWTQPESERQVLELIEYLISTYQVDPQKIALTGYSQGGRGVWYVAGRHPERFCAAIPVSAPPPAESYRDWKLPLYVIHSRHDEHFPYQAVVVYIHELRRNAVEVQFDLVEGLSHFETASFSLPLKKAVSWLQDLWARPLSKSNRPQCNGK